MEPPWPATLYGTRRTIDSGAGQGASQAGQDHLCVAHPEGLLQLLPTLLDLQ